MLVIALQFIITSLRSLMSTFTRSFCTIVSYRVCWGSVILLHIIIRTPQCAGHRLITEESYLHSLEPIILIHYFVQRHVALASSSFPFVAGITFSFFFKFILFLCAIAVGYVVNPHTHILRQLQHLVEGAF